MLLKKNLLINSIYSGFNTKLMIVFSEIYGGGGGGGIRLGGTPFSPPLYEMDVYTPATITTHV